MRGFLRSIDLGRAVLAVLLALALWIVVQHEQNPERSALTQFGVPVNVVGVPPGLTMVSEIPSISLEVIAPDNVIPRLRADDFAAHVDASGARAGVNDLTVQVDVNHSLVRSAEPRPQTVRVRLEEVRQREVPVRVNLLGSIPFGYSFSPPTVAPGHVIVSGPQSEVQRVESAVVDVRLEGITVNVSGSFNVRAVDGRGAEIRGVAMAPTQVTVEMPVQQEVGYKQVGIRPVTSGQPAPGYYLLPLEVDPPSMAIVGDPSVISAVQVLDTEPIDVTDAASTLVRRVLIRMPAGVSLMERDQNVLVTVRVQALELTQSIRVRPTVQGLGPTLMLSSEVPLIEMAVSGPAPTLQALSPSDFRVTLDLTNLEEGRHVVHPQAALPESFSLERLEPESVLVELTERPDAAARTLNGEPR